MSISRVVADRVTRIRTPRDPVDTAKEFHLEVDNAQRGFWLLSQGRERKARIMDGLAVALLMALMGALGCAVLLMAAPKAKADADPVAVAYAAHFADAVCWTLTNHDTNSGVLGVLAAIKEDGLTTSQAAYAVTLSVMDVCPQQQYVLDRFIDRYGPIQEKLA